MYDPYWSVKPMIIVCGYALLFGLNGVGGFAIFGMMLLYGFRLTSNFYRDWPGLKHEDWRYRDLRAKFPKAYWLVSFQASIYFQAQWFIWRVYPFAS